MHRLSDPAGGLSGETLEDVPGDAQLIGALRAGSGEAFDVLVSRHRHAARLVAADVAGDERADELVDLALQAVLTAVLAGGGPQVAFRPYVVAAVVGTHGSPRYVAPHDPADIWRDGSEAGTAVARLAERWQLLLWHVDVEGERPVQVAPLLGVPTSSLPALLLEARRALFDAHPGVPLAASLGPVVLGEAAAHCVSDRAPLIRRTVTSSARVPAVRTAAAVAAVVLIGAGAVTTAFAAVPARSGAPAGAAGGQPSLPIVPAPSDPTRGPASAQNGSDVAGTESTPGAGGAASATARPDKKSTSSRAPSFGSRATPSSTSSATPAPTPSADIGIAARSGADAVTWVVSGLPAGASTVVTIAADAGITLQPSGDDCTGAGSDRITCTVTAGEPDGSFTVSDLTLGNGEVSLSVQSVAGLVDPEPANNDSTVTP